MGQRRIHVLCDTPELPAVVVSALSRVNADVQLGPLTSLADPPTNGFDARLAVALGQEGLPSPPLESLLSRLNGDGVPILILARDSTGLEGLIPDGADDLIATHGALSEDELAGRLLGMCSSHGRLARISRELEALRSHDEALVRQATAIGGALSQMNEQMRLASRIQRDLLPCPLPEVDGVRCHVLYAPADRVSGDLYNVDRLDETHLSLAVADATGHGLPAALLTVLIKQGLRGKEIEDGGYRILPPIEVVERINRDLVESNLSDCYFVTVAYAVYDSACRRLSWVRAGVPFPILIREGQPPSYVPSAGPLVGAFERPEFEMAHLELRAGDTVLFYTDGLETLLTQTVDGSPAGDLSRTDWFRSLGRVPVSETIANVRRLIDQFPPTDGPCDDVTLLALEVTD